MLRLRLFLERRLPFLLFIPIMFKEIYISKCEQVESQFGEQALLKELTDQYIIDSYVDIGAGRPVTGSNTHFLYKKGIRGVTIDPILINHWLHKFIRRKDKNLRVLCGLPGAKKFFQFFPYEYSTDSKERLIELLRYPKADVALVRTKNLPVVSLSQVFELLTHPKKTLLNIDAEGRDLEIISTLDFTRFRPVIIVIEDWLNDDKRRSAIHEFMLVKHYKLIYKAGTSSIYK